MNQVLGPFELREELGRGGMGVVYRAFDARRGGEVALKVLPEHLASDASFVERFRREAQAAFDLSDPHIVAVHDYDRVDGRLYLSMQLVRGRDLAAILESTGPLWPERAVHILRQAAHALETAHAANLVHRDVKPSNLLVVESRDDFTYLVDFGIAHVVGASSSAPLTSTGSTIGTLAYMAPERLDGSTGIDGRVDVYSLTCVLVEMLTGQPPFPRADTPALIAAHLQAPPPRVTDRRPDLSPTWDALVARGMAKDPRVRIATPRALADESRAILGQPTTRPQPATRVLAPAGPPLPPYVPPAWQPGPHHHWSTPQTRRRSGRIGWIVAAVAGLALVGLVTVVLLGLVPVPGARQADPPLAAPTFAPVTSAARDPADLGLSVPLSTVACTGGYAVFVGAAVDPGRYATEVAALLDANPGASYLLAEQSCGSLRKRLDDGTSIYTVFYGPFPSLAQACAQLAATGGGAFVRVLDDTTPVGTAQPC